MSQSRVLDVGNCAPDYSAIKNMLEKRFEVTVHQANGASDALEALRSDTYALVLINRKLDMDYSDGSIVLQQIKAESSVASVPVMMVTNYDEHQQAAIGMGAVEGFGKLSLTDPDTISKLSAYLEAK